MLRKERTAIVFTANTPHLAHANLMLESLRDRKKGNFQGDIWVISTGLSVRAKNYLDSIGVKYLVNTLSSLEEWESWRQIAEEQPEYDASAEGSKKEESLRSAFEAYRNKRMSKLIILDWIQKVGDSYDFMALCDNDLYFQRDIHTLFEQIYNEKIEGQASDKLLDRNQEQQSASGHEDHTTFCKIYYWQEEDKILPGMPLWKKNYSYSCLYDASDLDFGEHEINIGFIMGKPDSIYRVFDDVKKSFFHLNAELFAKHCWHDQDLVRLNRAQYPERYCLIPEGKIVHLCSGGTKVVEERYPYEFYHLKTGEKPYVIHFAGKTWEKYDSVKATYMISPDMYYLSAEQKQEYSIVRQRSLQDPFDAVNDKYYTLQNKQSKVSTRKRWIDLAENGKKKLFITGWPGQEKRELLMQEIPQCLHDNNYNVAILMEKLMEKLMENSAPNDHGKLWEELPVLLTEPTAIFKDSYLVRTYGMYLPNVPVWLYEEIVRSAVAEWGCTRREAMAMASLVYLHFSDALDFYRPDRVLLCGEGPGEKMIKDLCSWKKIPVSVWQEGALSGEALLPGGELVSGEASLISGDKVTENRSRGNMEEPMVSVIMPVYNAEEYLAASINSICRQTLTDLELICVNNGSTDDSQKILNYFAAQDARIKVHEQAEPNQRAARNWGYDHAKGKYVYLIDSDDYLDVNALEQLVDAAESRNADLLYFFFREVRTDFNVIRPRPRWYAYSRFFPGDKVFKMEEKYYKFFIQYPFPWAKLIRRELVLNHHLYFDLDCSNFDDNPHNLRTLLSAQNIYVYHEQFYNFRLHKKSMTQSRNPRIAGMTDAVRLMNEIYQAFDCYDKYVKWYLPYKIHLVAWAWKLVPQELRRNYFNKVKELFYPGEEELFEDDFVWSYYEMPSPEYIETVRRMLSQSYELYKVTESGKVSVDTEVEKNRKLQQLAGQLGKSRLHLECALKWLELLEQGTGVLQYFEEHKYRKIGIYGIADFGKLLYEELNRSKGIKVAFFMDKTAEDNRWVEDVPVFLPEELEAAPEVDMIVVTATIAFASIKKAMLEVKPDLPVVSLADILFPQAMSQALRSSI